MPVVKERLFRVSDHGECDSRPKITRGVQSVRSLHTEGCAEASDEDEEREGDETCGRWAVRAVGDGEHADEEDGGREEFGEEACSYGIPRKSYNQPKPSSWGEDTGRTTWHVVERIGREEGGGGPRQVRIDDLDCVEVVGVDEETARPCAEQLGGYVDGDLLPREATVDSLDQRYLCSKASTSGFLQFSTRNAYHGVNVPSARRTNPDSEGCTNRPAE